MRAKTETATGAIVVLSLLAMTFVGIIGFFTLCLPDLLPKDVHASDYQRGWNAAAAAYRFDYARGVVEGQHRALAAHCVGPMEAPSE